MRRFIRPILKTKLAYGEGPTEEALMRYINSKYAKKNETRIVITNGGGGGPHSVIDHAIRQVKAFDFNEKFILLDSDMPISEKYQAKIKQYDFRVYFSSPCLEGLLLTILGHNISGYSSDMCKKVFHTQFLSKKDKLIHHKYEQHFPLHLLEAEKSRIELLSKLIQEFTN